MRPEHWLYTIPLRLRSLFRWAQADQELDDELHDHLERKIEQYVAKGMATEEARRLARLELSGVEKVKEECRDARNVSWIQDFVQDLRFGVRTLRKSPGFATVAILTLALGIGANTAIFSVINSELLQPLPFKNPAQLVALRETESAPGDYPLDGADYLDWQALNKTFASTSLIGFQQGFNASGAGEPEVVAVRQTQATFFSTLGVEPLIGRTFAKGEDTAGKNRVAVLSYGFWQRHFAGAQITPGNTLRLNDEPYTIIGVMPAWFNYPAATDIWTPLDMNSQRMHDRGSHWAGAIGRVKDGVTIAQARADLLLVSALLNKQYRKPDDQDIHSLVFPLQDYLIGGSQDQLFTLLGAVALVLLVACANIANLLLARSTGRIREMAVRAALGAGRWRLARQLLTESVLVSLCGAVLGLSGAWWGVSLLNAAQTSPIPRVNPVQVNATVLLFTLLVSILVGILFGLAPALQTSRLDLSEDLKTRTAVGSATGSGRALRNTLIIVEMAVSLTLLVGAGLLLRSFARMRSANIGVDPHNLLTMDIDLPPGRYRTSTAQKQFFDQLIARITHIPGVRTASVSTVMALEGGWNGYITVPGNTNPKLTNQLVEVNYITAGYFKTFGIPLIEGRRFTEQDMQQAANLNQKITELMRAAKKGIGNIEIPATLSVPVVINQAMARAYWPNQDPIGKSYAGQGGDKLQRVVIGVVGDERQVQVQRQSAPENYFPLAFELGDPGFSGIVSVKTKMVPAGLLDQVRAVLRGLDNTIGVYHVRTMEQVIAENMQDAILQTFLLGSFAALALVLAAVGLYGVMSYVVTQRTHEIGIRMALGASPAAVLRLVVVQGLTLTMIGAAIGSAGALALTRFLGSVLFEVKPTDPATFISVAIMLLLVAFAACYIPARRAMRVDPMVALRYE